MLKLESISSARLATVVDGEHKPPTYTSEDLVNAGKAASARHPAPGPASRSAMERNGAQWSAMSESFKGLGRVRGGLTPS